MKREVHWATADDIPALAEVVALAFPREFGQAFGSSLKRRAEGLTSLLRSRWLRWPDALVFDQRNEICGAALLCWEDSAPATPLSRCLRLLGRATGWLGLPWRLFVLSCLLEERPSPGGCEIGVLAVRADKRRKGVAQALLEAVEEEARRRGCDHLSLGVAANNEPALTLYRKVGFEVVCQRLNPISYLLFGSGRGLRLRKDLGK